MGVTVTLLATSGLRIGTLENLQYRHVKKDIERNVIPVQVCVPAEITKGKYNGYYTFINEKAANYLIASRAQQFAIFFSPPLFF